MNKTRLTAILLILAGLGLGFFVYYSEIPNTSFYRPFKLGLDLSGGSRLTYVADVSQIDPSNISDAMSSLREVIDRRINVFGVSEPVVQVERSAIGGIDQNRLTVELPGVTEVEEAVKMINETPTLEFRTERATTSPQRQAIIAAREEIQNYILDLPTTTPAALIEEMLEEKFGQEKLNLVQEDPDFEPTELTGRYLEKAQVVFNQNSLGPSILVEFDREGSKIFADLTKNNVGKAVGIFLDGALISAPIVREEISDGQAEISGQFTVPEAKTLTRNLNLGALPVPITLASTQVVGATLGEEAIQKGVKAGVLGLLIVAVFMILWYRLPGLVSVLALIFYIILMLSLFKLMPVTLTAAGMAGLILSIGIAIDANILIFERMKEEIAAGKGVLESIKEGFSRAWLSIRDSNLSSLISAVILFWFGSSLIKGFALTLMIGILVSMFTAITVTRTLLLALGFRNRVGLAKFLFDSGFSK